MPTRPTVVVDCRWLGNGGPGRTTEFLLRGMAEASPGTPWILWGPERATAALAWPGAQIAPIEEDPRVLLGQRRSWEIPRGDFYVFMHQQRPLRRLPAATLIYDTIALRHGGGRVSRGMKRQFMREVVRSSTRILTISEHSRSSILGDLGAAADRVEIVRFPFDDGLVDQVLARRPLSPPAEVALFIGGFLPHKNLPRLVQAFSGTAFRRQGGRLVLVGATGEQADGLWAGLDERQRSSITVLHSSTQAELHELYATALFLVQPSLEEGFGLPAWEAMCCGLPVCVSDGGSLPEVTAGYADPFPATSVAAMAAAIDACAVTARAATVDDRRRQSDDLRSRSPTVADFGARFGEIIERSAASPHGEPH